MLAACSECQRAPAAVRAVVTLPARECVSCGVRVAHARDVATPLCRRCAACDPVVSARQLAQAVKVAKRWLERKGIVFDEGMTAFQCDVPVVIAEFEPADRRCQFVRLASTVTKTPLAAHPKVRAQIDRIELRRGVPFWRAVGSLVHELGHAWLFIYRQVHGLAEAPRGTVAYDAEEGFCHMLSCYFWRELRGDRAANADLLTVWIGRVRSHAKYASYIDAAYAARANCPSLIAHVAANQFP